MNELHDKSHYLSIIKLFYPDKVLRDNISFDEL